MNDLFLKDVIHLSEDDIKYGKIVLNMRAGDKTCFEIWDKSNPREVKFSYHSHYGNKRNFTYIGQLCLGFVQLPDNNKQWLLVTAGRIKKIGNNSACDWEEIEEYKAFLGRLIVEINKGNKMGRYNFRLQEYYQTAKVIELLPAVYQNIKFKGFDNIHLKFNDLKDIIDNEKYADYHYALSNIKGVYCLTDTKTGKLYIGSAYGEHGLAQRWNDYLQTKSGGNVKLKVLYNKLGPKYFENHFEFTLLEFFGMNTDSQAIIDRESYWKDCLDTRKHGYNKN